MAVSALLNESASLRDCAASPDLHPFTPPPFVENLRHLDGRALHRLRDVRCRHSRVQAGHDIGFQSFPHVRALATNGSTHLSERGFQFALAGGEFDKSRGRFHLTSVLLQGSTGTHSIRELQ